MVTYHLPIILFFIYKYRPLGGFKKEPRNSQEVLNVLKVVLFKKILLRKASVLVLHQEIIVFNC